MTPEQLMNKASKDFNKFYSTGNLEVVKTKGNHVEIKLTDFPFSDHWNRSFAGFLEALTEYTTKAKNVHCRIKMTGGLACMFITDWD